MVDSQSQTLLMLRGLPASGKTTFAEEISRNGRFVRVNKDDIREGQFPNYKPRDEREVVRIEDRMIEEALSEGKSVVVDDTNLNPIHERRLRNLAEAHAAELHIKDFDVPLEECIQRNIKRGMKVPTSAIVEMYNKYINKPKKVEYDDNLDEAIVVDIDGTLAHIDGDNPRSPYDASRAMEDVLDDAVSVLTSMCYQHGYRVIILTGRHSGHLQVTKDWLTQEGVDYDEIYCRDEEDKRPDYIVKKELFEQHVKGKYNVKFILDDRPSVCRMWRSIGLKVLQVGDPHFEF